jgi:hypothetical protein
MSDKSTTKGRVRNALEKLPELRNDLIWLKQRMWETDLKKAGLNLKTMSAIELLEAEHNGILTNARSIQRWWCKWQEEIESLRGTEWKDRKHIKEPIVRDEMRQPVCE